MECFERKEAELRFSKPVIEAFYDEIQAGRDDPEALRETHIRLPNAKEDGYSRVLFVGTTGAGKTSLLRQLIGSDPDDDRFPSYQNWTTPRLTASPFLSR